MIRDKIKKIVEDMGKTIIVLRGFKDIELEEEKKYFSFRIDNYDEVDSGTIKGIVIDEIINNREFDSDYKWMTIEEYQLFKDLSQINKMPIAILDNNLYYKQYPYQGTLSDIKNIYEKLYYQEDSELNSEDEKLLEQISLFYGKIDFSKQSGNYFVTYPEIEKEIRVYYLYEESKKEITYSEKYPSEDVQRVELSDDEIPFLDLEEAIIKKKNKKNILLVISNSAENLPNRYLERLNILSKIKTVNIYFIKLSMKREIIENKEEYLKLLKRVYGFDNYREIDFYNDIENYSKETIKISQMQIIDDIINQAEKAINGESFRDIYITASTGSGKSVMFQIPALYLAEKYKDDKPLTLVISPLIGLMNDQVDGMQSKGIHSSATINGNTPPYEKEIILEKVKNRETDVLYLSPETLQARSDIKTLIADRNIGVVIIDEAHIVTTWGKSFRADYWYLGIYLSKLRKEYKFPIVTFTATAIYGGREDMYLDTINSLNMISPISYFGLVRRDDIEMLIRNSSKNLDEEGRDYRKTKNTLALRHLKMSDKNNEKSLLYFPTISLLSNFYDFLYQNNLEIAKKTGKYHGKLQKEEKDEVLSEFKSGELKYVLATKAFGMGIDIPDIKTVYHYAPTGNVVDYIQEIGRVARDKSKVKKGFGKIDFISKDMNDVKQLYGMSAIRKTQILEVMQKVLSIYKEKGNSRNLILSPEDFKYIFVQNNRDEESLDNKVKTVLLMIEKDFSSPNKLGYSPFVARPRSLFGNDLIFVTPKLEKKFLKSVLKEFFSKEYDLENSRYSAIYKVNLSGIWERSYRYMSFPKFKFSLFNLNEMERLDHKYLFKEFIYSSGVEVSIKESMSIEEIFSQYNIILKSFEKFINIKKISGKQFTVNELGKHFKSELKILDEFEARSFAQAVINAAFEFMKIKEIKFIKEHHSNKYSNIKYSISGDGSVFSSFIISSIKNTLNPEQNYVYKDGNIISFNLRNKNPEVDSKIAALGIGESRKMLSYQIIGGNNPQIYLRMNSIYPLEKAIKQDNDYKNSILEDVQNKHYTSVEMLNYLFSKKRDGKNIGEKVKLYSKWFWDTIEDYFMGILPEEVKENISKR